MANRAALGAMAVWSSERSSDCADAGIVLLCGWSFSDKSTVAANLAGDLGKVVDEIERKAASWLATRPAAQSCGERQPLTRQGYAAIVSQ